jgi:hypothetical protein
MTDDMGSIGGQRDQALEEILSAPVEPKPKGRLVALWVGVVALLGASLFAVTNLTSSSGGASSPDAAVHKMFDAVSGEDLLGFMASVAPSERDVFKEDLIGILDELKRLDVLSSDFDAGNISGVEVDITDLKTASKSLGEGVSTVTVSAGKAKTSVTPSELPLGKKIRDTLGEDLPTKTETDTSDLADEEPFDLVTVKEDGSWYVSFAYTAAEAMRKDAGKPAPKFGQSAIKPDGQSSPEKAVEAMLRAGAALDVEAVMALLPPGEGKALRDYSPLFLSDLKDQVASMADEVSIKITTLELSADTDGGSSLVSVKKLVADATVSGETTHVEVDGDCFTIVVSGGETNKQCASDEQKKMGLPNIPGLMGPGLGTTRLTAVQEDGEWYVSPIRSLLHPLHLALKKMDKGDVQDLIDFFSDAASGGLFGMSETVSGSTSATFDGEGKAIPGCDGSTVAGYSQEEFAQLSPEDQQAAYAEHAQMCAGQ